MGIKQYLSNYIESIINKIQFRKSQEQQGAYFNAASFDPQWVRIDDIALIANNRGHKEFITIGNNSWIKGELLTYKHGGKIIIGSYCFLGESSRIWSSVKIEIGNNVLISHNVNICDNISHPLNSTERRKDFAHIKTFGLQEQVNIREKEIKIGNDVWIGFNATILKGVVIGDGAVIGANTVITKDVPPFAIMVGNPAKVVRYTT